MKVSAVVPTFNNEHTIRACIESLLSQTFKNIEVVVVGKSKDCTEAIAKTYPIYIIEQETTRSEARNAGIKNSNGDILFFVESDAYYPPNYVEECVKFLVRNKLASTLGVERTWNRNKSWITKVEDAERVYSANTRDPMGGWFYRRKHINKVGMFKNIHIGEDVEFANRFRKFGKIKWCKKTSWYHQMPRSLSTLVKKNYLVGTHLKYFLRYSKSARLQILKVFYIPSLIVLSVLAVFFSPFRLLLALSILPLLVKHARFIILNTYAKVPLHISAAVIILWSAKSLARSAGMVHSLFFEEKNLSEKISHQKG